MTEFSQYYKKELFKLKELGKEFARAHPVLAPLLSGPSADADVERLLEGVAFLTAGINQKLDDEFPEILHTLFQMICPHFLHPIPSVTMMRFEPGENLNESIFIPEKTDIDSIPVDGVRCRFRTCFGLRVYPLRLDSFVIEEKSTTQAMADRVEIRLDFSLNGMILENYSADSLRLCLGGEYSNAASLYYLISHHIQNISVSASGQTRELGKDALSPFGFHEENALLPYPGNVFPSFRVIQEYFIFPEKFLFLDINLSGWTNRGEGEKFSITLTTSMPGFPLPAVNREDIHLFAVPAVNLFPKQAYPVVLEHRESETPLHPEGMQSFAFDVHSVEKVTGIVRGKGEQRDFIPFSRYSPEGLSAPVYHPVFRPGVLDSRTDVNLHVAYPETEPIPESEVVTAELLCTNGKLPDILRAGDIHVPTSTTPELVSFKNITLPTASQSPPMGKQLLWYVLSHLSMNFLSIASAQNLKNLLSLYLFPGQRDKPKEIANNKRISGILNVEVQPDERLFKGCVIRGQSIRVQTRNDHFNGPGDMYLFGSILDDFLSTYAAVNHYTRFTLEDILQGETITWPVRLGRRPLL